MDVKLPRIVTPNLGCPVIVSPEVLAEKGFYVVVAEPSVGREQQYEVLARPSYMDGLRPFVLNLVERAELVDPSLPPAFESVEETRFLVSTTLSASIFAGKARFGCFCAKPYAEDGSSRGPDPYHPRITLYDLVLKKGGEELFTVYHALAIRRSHGPLHFIHATDLHVSQRNDIYEATLNNCGKTSSSPFINFNENLRRFVRHANKLADRGQLDFVLMLGDIVDFAGHNHSDRDDYSENNWRVFRDIILGAGSEEKGSRPGLRVPVFTSTGNHDWRFFPYPPAANAHACGLDKSSVRLLDPFYADDPEELVRKTKEFYYKMIAEGALLSNIMLGGKYLRWIGDWLRALRDVWAGVHSPGKVRGNLLDWSLPRMATWQFQVLAPLTVSGLASLVGKVPLEWLGIVFIAVSGAVNGILGAVKFLVRWKSPDLMALEAGRQALSDYFLSINPHFNYAFCVDRNYFLILDTGYDCLRAQRFWDGGRKKLGSISIRDNILGHSPDSMAFFDANEFYPYSQITWLERLLDLVTRTEGTTDGPARIFVGLHAPPVNLSKDDREKAKEELEVQPEGVCLEKPYNIRHGSVNHYLSQFYHLCLGRSEGRPDSKTSRPVTMTLAGHAHWRLECSLRWAEGKPVLWYADYTGDPKKMAQCVKEFCPLLLQTPAIGPRGDEAEASNPPYFRWIEVDVQGTIKEARVADL